VTHNNRFKSFAGAHCDVLSARALAETVRLMNQTLYLYRYYKEGLNPFRSTSNLNDSEIIHFMKKHFPAHSWFHGNPKERIDRRRKIESWLHHQFLSSGGKPQTQHPCYFTLGESPFLKEFGYYEGNPSEVKIPLSAFSSRHISFTYPDSFFSEWLSRNKDHALYNNELNGKVFSLEEMLVLLKNKVIPNNVYMDTPFCRFHFYVEAQVWDYNLLDTLKI